MKKKLFVGIAAAALAAVMCVSFTACGSDAASKAKSTKGVEVTAEEWAAAFEYLQQDDAVFTAELSLKSSSKANIGSIKSSYSETVSSTVIKNNEKEYWKETSNIKVSGNASSLTNEDDIPEGKEVTEEYAEREGDGSLYTVYDKGDDGWEKSEHESSIVTSTTVFGGHISYSIASSYSSYKYSAEDKGYVLDGVSEGELSYIIKFNSDKKLAAIYCFYEVKEGEGGVSSSGSLTYGVVITYKAKALTIPTVA